MTVNRAKFTRAKHWTLSLVAFAALGAVLLGGGGAVRAQGQVPGQKVAQVSDVRVGLHGERTRLVLDLDREVKFDIYEFIEG